MKVRVIGTCGAKLDPGKRNTSFLINDDILLDCGPHTVEYLINSGVKIDHIKTLFITHLHLDHAGGVPEFIWQRALYGIMDPVNIIGPEKIKGNILSILKNYDTPNYMLHGVGFNMPYDDVKIVPGIHSVEDYTFRIKIGGQCLFYSGDTSYSENVIENGRNCDLFIHEATYPAGRALEASKYGHSTVSEAFRAFAESNSAMFIPTHMSPESLAQAVSMKTKTTIIPDPGMEYYI
jgi:ribonuclease Z